MAHYARLDENNIVTDVIVIADRNCLDENGIENEEKGRQFCQTLTNHANWKKTSYNTREGVYYDANTGEPSADQSKAFRLNYAQRGMLYDETLNGFVDGIDKKLHPRMIIQQSSGKYRLPRPSTPEPEDLQLEQYPLEVYFRRWFWNEIEQRWQKCKRDAGIEPGCFATTQLI